MKLRREIKIGIFATAMLLLLYWGINFLRGTDLLKGTNTYYATYDQVNGLQPSSAIMIKGLKVGIIKNLSYNPKSSSKIVVELNIKSKYAIAKNSKARIFSDGLLGSKAMEIELGDSPQCLMDGDTLHSVSDKDFLEVAGSEFEFMKQRANQVINEVMLTLGNVNEILESNAKHINTTMTNMASISRSLDEIVSSEEADIKSIISNINHLSKTLKNSSSKIENIIGNIDGFTDSLSRSNIPLMVENLSLSLGELNTTLAKVNSGQGTVGKFLNDESLYDSLNMATGNLSRLLEDMKANPGRYLQFSVFGKKQK